MKKCRDCNRMLPLEDFLTHSGSRSYPRCRSCQCAWKRARYREGERNCPIRPGEISSGPFLAWLIDFVEHCDGHNDAARRLGIDQRFLYRWLRRPSTFIRETTVDAMFCAADQPHLLRELYPELYEEAA